MAEVTRAEDGTPTIHVTAEEVRSGAFARQLNRAVDRLAIREGARRMPQDQRPPEFGVAAPKEVEGYQLSQEVADIVHRLVEREDRFGHIADYQLGCALQVGKKPEGKGGLHLLARAVKAPTLWRDLGEHEVVVWANQKAWVLLGERQREALIAHELSHIGFRSDSGNIVMLEHDIEEFGWVVRTYGQWHSGLESFAEQLGLGLQPPAGG